METDREEVQFMAAASDQAPVLSIAGRRVGRSHPPLVIAEIGINHEGSFEKAIRMVDEAARAGCECVKFQTHVIEDEMIPNDVIPGNANESIWDIMERCALSEEQDVRLKKKAESLGMIYLSTPFSRAAADRLERLGVSAYKIGSGECNNYPLIEHIAKFGKPVLLSTGMNDLASIATAVEILRRYSVAYALVHCTSMYPTPYEKVRLGALAELGRSFPDAVLGLSDHSLGNYTCYAAVALSASLLEKHFTADKRWPGPDVSISIDPVELQELIRGSKAIHQALGGSKSILPEEQPTIAFAYACVVTTRDVRAGEELTTENIWVKRPGTGEIKALHYTELLGRKVKEALPRNAQIKWANLL
jgi:N-acetylneuraminate synthase